jgi:hypothetical protein
LITNTTAALGPACANHIRAFMHLCIYAFMYSCMLEHADSPSPLYERCLPEDAFIAHDRKSWLKLATHFASLTGKPVLEYPFPRLAHTTGQGAAIDMQ